MTALATRQANTTLWDVIQRRPFDAGLVQRICHEMHLEEYCKPARDDERSVASAPAAASFTLRTSQNNCYGDPPACVFRGRKDSAAECEAVCAADAACRSFTWVGATGDSFAHECRTRNDTVWQLIPEGMHTSGYKGTPPTPAPFRCASHFSLAVGLRIRVASSMIVGLLSSSISIRYSIYSKRLINPTMR